MDDANDCTFCEIVDGTRDSENLLETDTYLCFLDKYPVNEGHALVIPKAHVQYLDEAKGSALYEFLERAIEEVHHRYEPDGMNIGLNDGPVAGQTISHLHWHIIPRYDGDMEDPTGGVRGVIPSEQTY
jgi:diadenosine tetraphosphate (Ap4A) HIT family hydrolase